MTCQEVDTFKVWLKQLAVDHTHTLSFHLVKG